MKTAIVDKSPSVSAAALVSSYHLLPIARDVVKRWQSETQEAATSTKSSGGFSLGFSSSGTQMPVNNSTMTQYHAIGLLYQMRMHDRMALVKMVQQFGVAGAVKNQAATVMLVRLAAQLADEDPQLRKPMMALLDGWLRHKSEMVNFEAAKAICDMRDVTDAEVTQAVHVLQQFMTSLEPLLNSPLCASFTTLPPSNLKLYCPATQISSFLFPTQTDQSQHTPSLHFLRRATKAVLIG